MQNNTPVGILRRLATRVMGASAFIVVLWLVLVVMLDAPETWFRSKMGLSLEKLPFPLLASCVAVLFLDGFIMPVLTGTSLFRWLLGYRILRKIDSGKPLPWHMAGRIFIFGIFWFFSYVTVPFRKDRAAVHDLLSRTRVLRLPYSAWRRRLCQLAGLTILVFVFLASVHTASYGVYSVWVRPVEISILKYLHVSHEKPFSAKPPLPGFGEGAFRLFSGESMDFCRRADGGIFDANGKVRYLTKYFFVEESLYHPVPLAEYTVRNHDTKEESFFSWFLFPAEWIALYPFLPPPEEFALSIVDIGAPRIHPFKPVESFVWVMYKLNWAIGVIQLPGTPDSRKDDLYVWTEGGTFNSLQICEIASSNTALIYYDVFYNKKHHNLIYYSFGNYNAESGKGSTLNNINFQPDGPHLQMPACDD